MLAYDIFLPSKGLVVEVQSSYHITAGRRFRKRDVQKVFEAERAGYSIAWYVSSIPGIRDGFYNPGSVISCYGWG